MKLVKRIFMEIGAPRVGVQTHFRSGDNVQICAKIAFAVFQSLYVMSSYLKANFKEYPSLSSEYVKFLASNTGLNQVEELSSKVKDIQTSINLQEKPIRELNKEGTNFKGKNYDLKRVGAIVEQRLKTLEKWALDSDEKFLVNIFSSDSAAKTKLTNKEGFFLPGFPWKMIHNVR